MSWQEFVLKHGAGARSYHLAAILGVTPEDVQQFKRAHRFGGNPKRRPTFVELFMLKHGRPPREEEWPAPTRAAGGGYEWLAPEIALLARLVGRIGVPQICRVLTARLRKRTGDRHAQRDRHSIQSKLSGLGLHASELLGGVTIPAAGRRVGSVLIVQQAVRAGRIRTFRVGHRHVIPRAELEKFLATRDRPPAGWVRLSVLRRPLGMLSDSKLPEIAKLGYIPAVHVRSSNLWFIAPETARAIIADAHAGRPLPWHGRPWPINTRLSWEKWRRRRHRRCRICLKAWGRPAPRSFADFARRYPALDLGLKRHLTQRRHRRHIGPRRPWGSIRAFRGAGITVREAALELRHTVAWVWAQIKRGVCRPVRYSGDRGQPVRITPAGMAKLRRARGDELRGRPPGVWLGLHAAALRAGVSSTLVALWGRQGRVRWKLGSRGRIYSLTALDRSTREYWRAPRLKRAIPPAWLKGAA